MSKATEIIGTVTISPCELYNDIENDIGFLKFLINQLEPTSKRFDVEVQLHSICKRLEMQYNLMQKQSEYYENFLKLFSPYNCNQVN